MLTTNRNDKTKNKKVGNLANDGIKLATAPGKCTAEPDDGLEQEAKGGTLR